MYVNDVNFSVEYKCSLPDVTSEDDKLDITRFRMDFSKISEVGPNLAESMYPVEQILCINYIIIEYKYFEMNLFQGKYNAESITDFHGCFDLKKTNLCVTGCRDNSIAQNPSIRFRGCNKM